MKPNVMNQDNWYVVYTYPNSEKKIYKELNKRDITAFLPTINVIRQWSDRKKKVEVPLFPNYVFVKIPSKEIWMVLMIDGVVRFISFEGKPTIVKDTEIDLVKRLTSSTNKIATENFCAKYIKGEKVQVKEGPLTGLVGIIIDKKCPTRLYVEVETVNQVLSIDIDAALLEKIS